MTNYDKFAFRKKRCDVCKRRFRFEPYNVEKRISLLGDIINDDVCYKCANKASKKLRKEIAQE